MKAKKENVRPPLAEAAAPKTAALVSPRRIKFDPDNPPEPIEPSFPAPGPILPPSISAPPFITVFAPLGGPPGSNVTILGGNFQNAYLVLFNGVQAMFQVSPDGSIVNATVPQGATTGPIEVATPLGRGASVNPFVVSAAAQAPSISGFAPPSGLPGTRVEIVGTNFAGATNVRFNGANSEFWLVDAGRIFATVPPGASTGPIQVVTPAGTAASFTPFVAVGGGPAITSVSPSSAVPGTQITIAGVNLASVTEVRFGGFAARFFSGGPNFLSAEVPDPFFGPTMIAVVSPAGLAFAPFTIVRPQFQFQPLNPFRSRFGFPLPGGTLEG